MREVFLVKEKINIIEKLSQLQLQLLQLKKGSGTCFYYNI